MVEDSPVRVGIVGLGTIGRIHADRIARLGGEVVGADLSVDARDAFGETYDTQTYASHEAMLDDGVDAMIVGVPNRFHEEVAVDGLDAGVDVLVEKPLAHTVESAERIAAAARESDGFCAVGFTMRFDDLTRRVVELRDAGRLGPTSHVGVEYLRRDFVPGDGRGWFTDPELAGGGVLMDLGVHVLDLALHLFDYPTVTEVSGVVRSEYGSYDVDDAATALLRCADGRTISIETSWKGTVEPSRACSVRGAEAGVAFEISGSELAVLTPDEDDPIETESVDTEDMHLAEDRAFIEAVADDGDAFDGTLEDALVVQRVIDAIYESSERGSAVELADDR